MSDLIIRIGFVGCGRIADVHEEGVRRIPQAELTALCDVNPDALARRSAQWRISKTATDYRRLLDDPDIDAVVFLTPHNLHCRQVIDGLQAGKHVLVEKPAALSLEEVDRMAAAAAAAPAQVCQCIDNFRWYPVYNRAAELLAGGVIGEPLSMRYLVVKGDFAHGWAPSEAGGWRNDPAQSGGHWMTFDVGVHVYTMIHLIAGPVKTVRAWPVIVPGDPDRSWPRSIHWTHVQHPRLYGAWDTVDSPKLHLNCERYPVFDQLEIYGSSGYLHCSSGFRTVVSPLTVYTHCGQTQHLDLPSTWESGFYAGWNNFIEAIRGNAEPHLSMEECRPILRTAHAVARSAETGEEVNVDSIK